MKTIGVLGTGTMGAGIIQVLRTERIQRSSESKKTDFRRQRYRYS